ncbi:claret isoform a [Anaeramoeba ignava]|uniref:Claret isoform a n=1 Tax=Anaeramoeba ignava TaxID=1746090 RepID=A0A9Q0LDT9_ANAIG|nr:claret isoform a [Anaeramoeba ignava]
MNEIIFFGRNEKPELIKNEQYQIKKPIQFKFENENENENEKQIKQISTGDFSTIFLFKNGKAIEYLKYSKQNPEKSKLKKIFKKIIQDIVSDWNSIYLLTSNQNAYGIGSNEYGQLGNTSRSVFLLNSNQELFGCGWNYYGQLGLGESRKERKIQKLTQIQNIPKGKIIDIQSGYFHSIMLIENENENENPKRILYSCGYYQYNGLGQDIYEFTEIKSSLFENDYDNILDFSVGNAHTLILTSNSKLIGFGLNYCGQLGTGDTRYQLIPIQIELPKLRFNEDISNYHVYCGFNRSFLYYSSLPFSNLEEDLIKLFERKEFCDISFKTKNGEITKAHKLILKYRLKNQNEIEKLKEIISNKSIKESNQIFEMIYSNRIINPKLYSEIKEIINSNEKIEETMKRIYLNENENENEKDFIIERKEKKYKFPKLILIMRSELYRGMFLSVTEDKSNKVRDYSELSNKSFQIFEYWIYSNQIKNEIEITQEIIDEIQIGIDYFQLNETNPNLIDLLINKFNNQN